MEPTLTSLLPRARIPGDGERLQAPIGKLEQILLQRRQPEGVGDLEVGQATIRPLGAHDEPAVTAQEGRRDAVLRVGLPGERGEHRALRGGLDGAGVL